MPKSGATFFLAIDSWFSSAYELRRDNARTVPIITSPVRGVLPISALSGVINL